MTQNNERELIKQIALECGLLLKTTNLDLCPSYLTKLEAFAKAYKAQNEQQPKQIPDGWKLVPIEPSDEHLRSMAIRSDHGLGVDGYYDTKPIQFGASHAQRMESTIREMRQLYEEAIGEGFYKLPAPTNTEVGE